MLVLTEIKRQPVIQRGNLTIDPQCYTVTLAGEEIDRKRLISDRRFTPVLLRRK